MPDTADDGSSWYHGTINRSVSTDASDPPIHATGDDAGAEGIRILWYNFAEALPPQTWRPRITLKAQPVIAMAPARVVLTAEISGGANDFEEFYCPAVEWEWGDGTHSESASDCAPYEPGKSEIKRRYTVEHVFRAGAYRVMFHLKRSNRSV